MAADANPGEAEKLVLPSADFFANVKYHVMGSLQDQVSLFVPLLLTFYEISAKSSYS